MRVFVTGASGFIGRAVVPELLAAGHQVEGLVRSDAAASALTEQGATARRGDLDDLEGIRAGAENSDGVVHLANKHDWANPAASNRAERGAVETISQALTGSDRPFVFASGLALFGLDHPATERDRSSAVGVDSPRGGAENLALGFADQGVRVVSARFAPTVHGEGDHGFISIVSKAARQRGRVGLSGRRREPLARRAPTGHRAIGAARAGERTGRLDPACRCRAGSSGAADRRGVGRPARCSGQAGAGRAARAGAAVHRRVPRRRHPGVQRRNPRTARLGTDRAYPAGGHRRRSLRQLTDASCRETGRRGGPPPRWGAGRLDAAALGVAGSVAAVDDRRFGVGPDHSPRPDGDTRILTAVSLRWIRVSKPSSTRLSRAILPVMNGLRLILPSCTSLITSGWLPM